MRNTSLVYMGLVCALFVTVFHGGLGLFPISVAFASPLPESADSHNNLPKAGDKQAFVTKADGMVSTVQSLLQSEDYEAAMQAALELTEYYPEFVQGWMLLGYCRSMTEDFAGSNEAYEKALSLGVDPTSVLTRKAYNHIRLGEFDDARACYRLVLESRDTDFGALKQIAYLEVRLGNDDAAAHYYRRALEVEPNNTAVILSLAKIEAKRGGNGTVRELIEKGLEIDPDNTAFLGKLGVIHIKEKDYAAALDPLKKLVSLEPDNAKAYRNLAAAYYQLGDKKNALAAFEKNIELGGKTDDLFGPLADCYMAMGRTGEALVVIKDGIGRGIEKARLYSLWGKILEQAKDYDGAIGKFSKAVQAQEEPWSKYAEKQIARQTKLMRRDQMMAKQAGSP